MGTLVRHLRLGLRTLGKNPAFTAISVLCLALGIGATTAIFSVVNAVVLRALPYPEPDRLVVVWNQLLQSGMPRLWASPHELLDYREQSGVFERLAGHFSPINLSLVGASGPERVQAASVSSGFFEALGIEPLVGRWFHPEEDQPGRDTVVILSHNFWQRNLGGVRTAVGQTLNLRGQSYTIVGVMPPGFRFFPSNIELWVPLALDPSNLGDRKVRYLHLLGELKPGFDVASAQADMARIARNLQETYPDAYPLDSGWGTLVIPLQEQVVGNVRQALWILMGAVVLVLLIACSNVASMLLVRATTREREVAVRMALGSGRGRLVLQFLTEGLLLSLLAAGVGLAIGHVGMNSFIRIDPESVPRSEEIGLDLGVLAFTLGLSLATGVVFALVPVLHSRKIELQNTLKEGGRSAASSRNTLRYSLVVSEVALVLVLLIASGLMMQSFLKVRDVDPGYDTENILTARIVLPRSDYAEEHQQIGFYQRLLKSIEGLPQVEKCGAVSELPLSGAEGMGGFTVESRPLQPGEGNPIADWRIVAHHYFEAIDIPLLSGRYFTEADHAEAAGVVIVDAALARDFWPDRDPLGQRLNLSGLGPNQPWLTVVGVVETVRHYGLEAETRHQLYMPIEQFSNRSMYLAVRTTGNTFDVVGLVRDELRKENPTLPLSEVKSMEELLAESTASRRFSTLLFAVFAGVAFVLAVLGIYGVMSYTVARRTQEVGLRMALGAHRRDVLFLVLKNGLTLAVAGVLLGIGIALSLTRFMEGLLFEVEAADVLTFVSISLFLILVSTCAVFVPAWKATGIQPVTALRYE
jgi:putative ABC transport system permease protein